MVEPFIDPVTRKKIVLLPRDEAASRAVLERDIGAEVRAACCALRAACCVLCAVCCVLCVEMRPCT